MMHSIYFGFVLLLFPIFAFSLTLKLERTLPVINFTVLGSADQHQLGFYYTKVKIGSPPRDFNLVIDTGSDTTWISCRPCDGCPAHNRFEIPLNSYNLDGSSSASQIFCSDRFCQIIEASCGAPNPLCTYSFKYEDTSLTKGYYVSDTFHFESIMNGSATNYSSTSVAFGCSHYQSGRLHSDTMVDGILGLGHLPSSIISQLSSRGVVPKIFSHCLRRDNGGVLVLGEIVQPGIIYSPLVPSGSGYNLNLQSITMNGKTVDIDRRVFASGETVIDSGTTLLLLAEKAYDPLIDFLTAVVSRSAKPVFMGSTLCFQVSGLSRVYDIFPVVSFNFEGAASMVARPQDYLILQSLDSVATWCIGFRRGHESTILGDLVLRDKIVIYDLANQRLGWTDYDCSQSVNVSSTVDYVNPRHRNGSNSAVFTLLKSIFACTATFLVYISML